MHQSRFKQHAWNRPIVLSSSCEKWSSDDIASRCILRHPVTPFSSVWDLSAIGLAWTDRARLPLFHAALPRHLVCKAVPRCAKASVEALLYHSSKFLEFSTFDTSLTSVFAEFVSSLHMLAFLEQMVFWPMVRHKDPAAPATTLPTKIWLLSVRQWACLNFGITLVCITCSLTRHLKGIESWGIALVCTTHWLTQHLQDVENKTVGRLQQGICSKAEDYCNSHKNGIEGVHGQTQNRNLFTRSACTFKAWAKAMVDYDGFMIY